MKIFLIVSCVFFGIILLILLLLAVKAGFYAELYYTKAEGFKFTGKITWGPFCKSLGKKGKKEIALEAEKEENEVFDKSESKAVDIIKNIAVAVKELIWVPGKVLEFKKQCVWCKVALCDPMKNGITYGAISSALIGATELIICRFKTDEYKVRVTPDFTAKDGISIKDITWVQFRPIVLIICLIYAYTKSAALRGAVHNLLKLTKQKEGKKHE